MLLHHPAAGPGNLRGESVDGQRSLIRRAAPAPAAAAAPAGSASPAPLVLPPPRPRSSLFSPGSVQAPSSLPARLLSLPRPPGSAPAPGGAGLQLPRRSHHRRLSRAPSTPGPLPPGEPSGSRANRLGRKPVYGCSGCRRRGGACGRGGCAPRRGEKAPRCAGSRSCPAGTRRLPWPPGWPCWVRGLRPRPARLGVAGRPGGSIAAPASPCPSPARRRPRSRSRCWDSPLATLLRESSESAVLGFQQPVDVKLSVKRHPQPPRVVPRAR